MMVKALISGLITAILYFIWLAISQVLGFALDKQTNQIILIALTIVVSFLINRIRKKNKVQWNIISIFQYGLLALIIAHVTGTALEWVYKNFLN